MKWAEDPANPEGAKALILAILGHGRAFFSAHAKREMAEIVSRLVKAYEPERIYLFGSTARGDTGPDSDYDLLVIVPDDAPPERRRSGLAYEVLRGTGVAADVIVWPRSYYEGRRRVRTSLSAVVEREGKLLHVA